jgi:peroxiredoxin
LISWIKRLSKSDLIGWSAILFLLALRVPKWVESYELQGREIPAWKVGDFQRPDSRKVILFWASWCGPCRVELSRFHDAVAEGKLRREQVIAISTDESESAYQQAVKERMYSFQTVRDADGSLARMYQVNVTPTLVFEDEKGVIQYYSTGMSLIAPWKARYFLGGISRG